MNLIVKFHQLLSEVNILTITSSTTLISIERNNHYHLFPIGLTASDWTYCMGSSALFLLNILGKLPSLFEKAVMTANGFRY